MGWFQGDACGGWQPAQPQDTDHVTLTNHTSQGQHPTRHTTYLEAITKVDVHDLATLALKHEVGRVAIAKPQDIAHHAHDSEALRVVGATFQPHLSTVGLEPQHLVQVLAGRVLQRVLEHLHGLDERQVVIHGRHTTHEAVLDVQQDLALLTEALDERVDGVTERHPAHDADVVAQRSHRVPLDAKVALRRVRFIW